MDIDKVDMSNYDNQDKTTTIKDLIRTFELRLDGHIWSSKGDDFIYTGEVLCGSNVIQKGVSLLGAFAEKSLLISEKDFHVWSRQKWELCSTFNEEILKNETCPRDNQKIILKMFKTTLQNIGDIILSSKGFMRDMFIMPRENTTIKGDL